MAPCEVFLPACTLHYEPDSLVATSVASSGESSPSTLESFLEQLRPGWALRFSGAFAAASVEFNDIPFLSATKRERLEEEFQKIGAKMLHIKILQNALDDLASQAAQGRILPEGSNEVSISQAMAVKFDTNCFNFPAEGKYSNDSCMKWQFKGSKSMPSTPCHHLLDDHESLSTKVTFGTSFVCNTFSKDSDASLVPKCVDNTFLPYKSPCAAYFDGCDEDFSFSPIVCKSDSLSMFPLFLQESCPDAAPCTATSIISSSATNTVAFGVCSAPPSQFAAQARFPSKIQYSYDTLTSRCDVTLDHNVDGADEKTPLLLVDLIGANFMDGRLWELSQDMHGCREVQNALDDSLSDRDIESIADQMRDHVWEAMRCPHANHVLRKVVQSMPSSFLNFIIEEIKQEGAAGVKQFASHRYGCRIMEELLQTCSAEQLQEMLCLLLAEAEGLCTHMYGNFVMKAFLRHASLTQRQQLVRVLLGNVATMGTNFYACAVLAEVLQSNDDQSKSLAHMIVRTTGLLSAMACHKHGRSAVEGVLRVLQGAERQAAVNELALPPLKIAKASRGAKNPRA